MCAVEPNLVPEPVDPPVFDLCEYCGSEGRLYEVVYGSTWTGAGWWGELDEADVGPCPVCQGTGREELACVPAGEPEPFADCEWPNSAETPPPSRDQGFRP